MKVKCLVTECDVTAGKVYETSEVGDNGVYEYVYVKDDIGDDYPLWENEYEVVE